VDLTSGSLDIVIRNSCLQYTLKISLNSNFKETHSFIYFKIITSHKNSLETVNVFGCVG
jgi:hypothetical protein